MAGDNYLIIPKTYAKTAATTATALYSVTLPVPAFVICANGANTGKIYLGDSGVAAAEGITLNARESVTFGPFNRDRANVSFYDVSKFYIRATAASQVATIMLLDQARDNG